MSTAILEPQDTVTVDLGRVLTSIDDLPSIPETLIAILKVLDDPNSGPADLAATVRRDAPLMAKILRLANSPYYSPRGNIADINRCVAVLGYRTVRQVAICVSVATVLVKAISDSTGQLDYRDLWQHSVVTGAVAKHLAGLAGHPDPEEVFTAGLLHDIGKFILELYAPEQYALVVNDRARLGQESLASVERRTFGFDHTQLGAAFARLWRFPEVLACTLGGHHGDQLAAGPRCSCRHATALVALADALANELAPPRTDLGFDPRLVDHEALFRAANVTAEAVATEMDSIRESVKQAAVYVNLT